jgi:hypothetical protein
VTESNIDHLIVALSMVSIILILVVGMCFGGGSNAKDGEDN